MSEANQNNAADGCQNASIKPETATAKVSQFGPKAPRLSQDFAAYLVASGNYEITIFRRFPPRVLSLFSTRVGNLDLQNLKKIVISYRIACEPSNRKASSNYALCTKAYRRYDFEHLEAISGIDNHNGNA